jgi:hypothetical protein
MAGNPYSAVTSARPAPYSETPREGRFAKRGATAKEKQSKSSIAREIIMIGPERKKD